MSVLSQLNSLPIYLICGFVVLFVALVCVFFLIRAYRAGIAIGMDRTKLRRTITASATFAVLPSVGILLGVIALSGSLGTPLPWLRLSVIGALHYETQVAVGAAEAIGLHGLSAAEMTVRAFTTIALVMSFCMMWEMLLALLFSKRYLKKLEAKGGDTKKSSRPGFGDSAMTAMFIGLVCAYIGSYVGGFVSGQGLFSFGGSWLPLAVAAAAGAAMAGFLWLAETKKAGWVENFSIAGSMILGMGAAVLLGGFVR